MAILIRDWPWLILGLAPLWAALVFFAPAQSPAVVAIALISPAYMLHQIEEHWRDRFRTFVNQRVFCGFEALTPAAVFWINAPIVWGLNLVALFSARVGRFDVALVAVHVMLVNAVVHTLGFVRFGYNPGLVTSLIVFLPLSLAAILTTPAPLASHLVAVAIAISGHALILGYALLRVRRLRKGRL